MQNPTVRMNRLMIGQPHAIAAGPPLFQPTPKVVKHPARMEMMENEIAKLENPDHDRSSSCLYPSSARRRSSSDSSLTLAISAPSLRYEVGPMLLPPCRADQTLMTWIRGWCSVPTVAACRS